MKLVHIYGPFYVHAYGFFILLGLISAYFLLYFHSKRIRFISYDQLNDIFCIGIIAAIAGGKISYLLQYKTYTNVWYDFFALWQGGFTILGSIIGVALAVPLYLRLHNLPIAPLAALASLVAPLIQSLGRIGCFFAGCCYGNALFFVPIQLISSCLLLILFAILYYMDRTQAADENIVFAYLIGASAERFLIDFFREDKVFLNNTFLHLFSVNQWLALAICLVTVCCMMARNKRYEFI